MTKEEEATLAQLLERQKNDEDLPFEDGVELQRLINRKKVEDKRESNIRKNDKAVYDSLISGEGI